MHTQSRARSIFHLAAIATGGVTASIVMFCVVRHLERSRSEALFQQVAEQRLSVVRSNIAGALDTVGFLASHFQASSRAILRRRAFTDFVAPSLAKHHYIQALEWIPRVAKESRPGYERRARSDGLTGFCFKEVLGTGPPVEAAQRAEYFPVFFVEPFAGNERALGYDLACSPARLAALQHARDSGQIAVTAGVTLVQEKSDQYGILVFAPVYGQPNPPTQAARRAALRGFALGVFRIGDFISQSGNGRDGSSRVSVHLLDLSAGEPQRQLYPTAPKASAETLQRGLHAQQEFEVGGRTWLLVATPGPGFRGLPSEAGVVLLFGLVVTAIYVLYLRQRIRQSEEIARSARKVEVARQSLTEAHRIAQLGSIEHVLGTHTWRVGPDARPMLALALSETKGELAAILRNVHQDDRSSLTALLLACEAETSPPAVDTEFRVESGSEGRVIHALGKSIASAVNGRSRMLVTLQDVTARRQAQEALRRSEERFQLAARATKDLIWDWDLASGSIWRSDNFWQNFGYAPSDVEPGQPEWLQLLHPDDCERVWQQFQETLQRHDDSFRMEYRFRRANGSYALVVDRAYIVYNLSGQAIRAIGAVTDVSERRRLEDQLRQAQKLEAIGQLAAGIAHEINTPIQYVSDNANFLKDCWPTVECLLFLAQQEHEEAARDGISPEMLARFGRCLEEADLPYLLAEIPRAGEQTIEGVERVAKIVRAMKDFSHPGSEEKCAFDLNHAIETTITIARNEWKYVAELETRLDPNLMPVLGIASRLNQVILNLLINSAHAIRQVVGDGSAGKGKILVATRQGEDWVEFSVSDTGAGIREEIRGRIFEPFFTTKPVGLGTGQGLALAHAVVVQDHGGRIWFDTEVGVGTTFFVRLPRAGGAPTMCELSSVTAVTEASPAGPSTFPLSSRHSK